MKAVSHQPARSTAAVRLGDISEVFAALAYRAKKRLSVPARNCRSSASATFKMAR